MAVFRDNDPRAKTYPFMNEYTSFLKKMERPLVGREKQMRELMAAMMRPELCNCILLGEAGSGKTALVQGTMLHDENRAYLEINLPKMISNLKNENEMADKLKTLFGEVEAYRRAENKEVVLFIDEFHQIVQLSAAAVEVLKPLLADSGTRGIRVIAATTYIEYQEFIAPNLPLVERLQRINIPEPDKATVVAILRGISVRYNVANQFKNDSMFEAIYDYTNRYIPANAQPRKSLLMLDNMIGWHRLTNQPIDMKMLADVIYMTEGINIALHYDAHKVKEQLDAAVYAQQAATSVIAARLQICCADMNNKNKPMSSFLFAGSTGVGKGFTNDTIVPVYTEDGSVREKRNGDLKPGDKVFNRKGEPVSVIDVFPKTKQTIYKVTLTDGRSVEVDGDHLWSYMRTRGKHIHTSATKDMYGNIYSEDSAGRKSLNYWIPVNGAVQYEDAVVSVDPYVMGAFLGDGCMTVKQLTLSSGSKDIAKTCATLLGGCTCKKVNRKNTSWVFPLCDEQGRVPYSKTKSKQLYDVFGDYPEVCGKKSSEKRIPFAYMTGSIEQRWRLINGIFDTAGEISDTEGGRYIVSFVSTSEALVKDIQRVLYSLGIASSISVPRKKGNYAQYRLKLRCKNADKVKFFTVPEKLEIAKIASSQPDGNQLRSKECGFADLVGIASIEKLSKKKETTCIYVDDPEHLYQAGDYVVSHNTEMAKQLSKILFESDRNLIRIDMTEYANPESMERFRSELTAHIWEHPFSIVLLDEIEKACAEVTRLLLQVLDDGRLIDRHNREVTFKNCYIIVTTNAGSSTFKDIAQYNASDTGDSKQMDLYEGLFRKAITNQSSGSGGSKFPPELFGRIDCIVPFQPLSENTMQRITKSKLQKIGKEVYDKYGMTLNFDNNLIPYIAREKSTTDSDAGGARAVVSRTEKEILSIISTYINDQRRLYANDRLPEGLVAYVYVVGKMAISDKFMLHSDCWVAVDKNPPKKSAYGDWYLPPQDWITAHPEWHDAKQ